MKDRGDFDLGLAVSHATQTHGVPRTLEEIARFCGCRKSTIYMIERSALRKLRKKLSKIDHGTLVSLGSELGFN